MKIFKITTTHSRYGSNWNSYCVFSRNADEAVRKIKKQFVKQERVETIELLAAADY